MKLKEIDIKGFKSFADKTSVKFKDGVTAIVGPNGSGKSNISDAVRWVLGEQSLKTLRGNKMEDVIFSGTNARKPLGYAEVTITFDNRTKMMPIEYDEVAITRRVFRSGESEFYINKNACRLKDIRELLLDTGIGKEGYSIIGQGRIDEILSNKSEERRGIFEEAAGIVKYKVKKEESEKKLKRTEENLLRINDLIIELSKREKSLKDQAAKAKIYQEIYEELKLNHVNLLLHKIDLTSLKLEDLEKLIVDLEESLGLEEENFSRNKSSRENLKLEEEELENTYRELAREKASYLKTVEAKKNEINIYLEQKRFNEKDIARLEGEVQEEADLNKRLEEENLGLRDEIKIKEAHIEDIRSNFAKDNDKLGLLMARIEDLSLAVEKEKDYLLDVYNKISEERSKLNSTISFNENIESRIGQLRGNIASFDRQAQEESQKLELFQAQVNKLEEDLKLIREDKARTSRAWQDKKEFLDKLNRDINKLDIDIETRASSYALYKNMEDSYEGYYKGVKNILRAAQADTRIGDNLLGLVADLIDVDEKYSLAINTALGSSSQFIVTQDQYRAKNIIDYLKNTRGGRVTCLPLDRIRGKALSLNEEDRKTYKVLGLGSELVGYDKKYKDIVENLLGRTVIIENMDEAIRLSNKYNNSLRIVTLAGDIINPGGSMTGGSNPSSSSNLISRKNTMARLEEEIISLRLLKDEKGQIELSTRKEILGLETRDKELDGEIKKLEIAILEGKNKLANMEELLARLGSSLDESEKEIQTLSREEENYKLKKEEIEKEIKNLESQIIDTKEKIDSITNKLNQHKEIKDLNSEELTEVRIKINQEENLLSNLRTRLDQNLTTIEKNKKSIKDKEKTLESLASKIGSLLDDKVKNEEYIDLTLAKMQELEKTLGEKEASLKNMELAREKLIKDELKYQENINGLRDKKAKTQVDLAKEELLLNKYGEDLLSNYSMDYEEASLMKSQDIDLDQAQDKVQSLSKKIRNIGHVNLESIGEYESLAERLKFINDQKDDLNKSKKDLNKIIRDMEVKMTNLFKLSFDEINKNFKLVFKTLFNGGDANLILEDENDILNTGIDIEARPPGKKTQNLASLSGGERSLVAVAILFAILKMKPSPFCVLDEIDAALDEANIGRYTSYLQDISQDTQFIIITHRKGTMEMADMLYGVTMEEEGVSKLIAVELKDYN